jgi:hypothetical protein
VHHQLGQDQERHRDQVAHVNLDVMKENGSATPPPAASLSRHANEKPHHFG